MENRDLFLKTLHSSWLYAHLEKELSCHNLPSKSIAVAVSGGPDSLLLCLLLNIYCQEKDLSLTALHVNHGLRNNSNQEAKTLEAFLIHWNIPFSILTWEKEHPITSGLQQKARTARFKLMTNYCHENGISSLFLAHHLDDQIETVLMRLFRGSGLTGLTGISSQTHMNGIKIIRPFLEIEKESFTALLKDINQPFFEDPSNEDPQFLRALWRKALKKVLTKQTKSFFLKSLKKLNSCETAIQHYVSQTFDTFTSIYPLGYAQLENAFAISDTPHEIKVRVLEKLLHMISGDTAPIRRHQTEDALEKLSTNLTSPMTLGGCLLTPKKDHILITREIRAISPPFFLSKLRKKLWDQRFYIDKIDESLKDTTVEALSTADIHWLKDKKVDMPALSNKVLLTLPVVKKGTDIVAAPNLGYNCHLIHMTFIGCT